jgi:enoyl-CoA hydratase/carnithine racemase
MQGQQSRSVKNTHDIEGLVTRVFPDHELESNVTKVAEKINSYSSRVVTIIKESVKKAEETFLTSGLAYEKLLFQSTFSLVTTFIASF